MRKLLLCLPLVLAGCVDFPNQYAPTRARRPDVGPDPRGLKPFIDMKDPASLAHFAWGLNPAAFDGEKRKAEPKAALRFLVYDTANLKLSVDFLSTQPQRVRIKVNLRTLGEIEANGTTHFEANVEPGDFVSDTATLVEIQSESGLSLFRAGFVRR